MTYAFHRPPHLRLSPPLLWERAKAMFRDIRACLSPETLGEGRLANRERRNLREWLAPVEALARSLLVTRAIAYLLMTPAGRALMRAAHAPAPVAARPSTRIPHPGIASLARMWRPEPPPPPPKPPRTAHRHGAPQFRVLDAVLPAWARPQASPPATHHALSGQHPAHQTPRILRRIDALGRVLARPDGLIARLARRLARLPAGVLRSIRTGAQIRDIVVRDAPEQRDASAHLASATRAYYRTLEAG